MGAGELLIDQVLRKRAEEALRAAGVSLRPKDPVIRVYAPYDTCEPVEVFYVDGDGTGDFVYMEQIGGGKLKVVPDP